jgi:hypothetical protein
MSIKIKDIGTKYILDWNVDKSFLSLSTFNLSTWNQTTEEYDTTLDSIKKIGSPDYGNMFDFSSGSTTIVSSSGVYYLLNCTTTSLYTRGFTHSTNRLTKVGAAWGPIKLEGNIALSSSNNDEVHVKFYKNGTEIPCSLGSMVMSSGGKGNTIPFHCMTDMIDGDYIEVYVANMSGTTDITLENMNIILSELV